MELRFKRLTEDAVLPRFAHEGDSGMDIYAPERVVLEPYDFLKFNSGLACDIPHGYELQVRPRSGLAAHQGVVCFFGTVDMGYRGDIGITLFNHSCKQVVIEKHDRVAQLVLCPVVRATIVETDELSDTERGTGGFGSSGK